VKIKSEPKEGTLEHALGGAGNVSLVPVFISSDTYEVILERAKKDGVTTATVFERALYKYLNNIPDTNSEKKAVLQPIITVKRKNRL
jgi:hypothetical protein